MRRLSLSLAATLSISLLSVPAAFALPSLCDATAGNLVKDCGFEQFVLVTAATHVPGFTQGGDTTFTAITPQNLPSYDVNTGAYALQMGNSGTGTLSQVIPDVAGGTLSLSFYLEGDTPAPNSFTASIDGTTLYTVTNDPSVLYAFVSGLPTFTATGSDTLLFTFSDGSNYLSLDDIVLTERGSVVSASTPEPSSLALLGTGILGLTGFARRKFLGA